MGVAILGPGALWPTHNWALQTHDRPADGDGRSNLAVCIYELVSSLILFLAGQLVWHDLQALDPSSYILDSLGYTMAPYLGLRGNALLRAAVMLVVCPTFTCYGYNMSVAGGLLTLDAFNSQFPRMDTIHTEGTLQEQNSQIQGRFIVIPIWMFFANL